MFCMDFAVQVSREDIYLDAGRYFLTKFDEHKYNFRKVDILRPTVAAPCVVATVQSSQRHRGKIKQF